MAGHSKWAQIKRQKAVTDAAKSRTFSRHARLIALEAKKAQGNANAPSLKAAIERAKQANMPKDNIERAVAKGISKDGNELACVTYECYGPGGVAIVIDALTDNKNRTTQEIKHLLSKHTIELGTPGSAVWAFTKSSEGAYTPNEPLMALDEESEGRLGELFDALDEQEDVQAIFSNARGYENTGD